MTAARPSVRGTDKNQGPRKHLRHSPLRVEMHYSQHTVQLAKLNSQAVLSTYQYSEPLQVRPVIPVSEPGGGIERHLVVYMCHWCVFLGLVRRSSPTTALAGLGALC